MSFKKHVFTPMEKKYFVDLLKHFSAVIENKNTDGASLRAKNEAWDSLTSQYNASPHATTQVTTKQLRRLWMNIKQRQRDALTKKRQQVQRDALTEQHQGQRQALSRERQYRLGTGGGPPISDAVIDPDVTQAAPALLVGIEDAIDSDVILDNTDNMSESILQPGPQSSTFQQELLIFPSTSQSSLSAPMFIQPPSPPPQPLPTQSTPPPSVQTPPLPLTPPPTTPIPRVRSASQNQLKTKLTILENEYKERQRRANEIHQQELLLFKEKIREAKAKADLA